MKAIALTTLFLILGATVFAEPPDVEITARYEAFDNSPYAETVAKVTDINKSSVRHVEQILGRKALHKLAPATSQVTTKLGQRCQIEIGREVQVPKTPNGEKTVNSGVALDFLPLVKDGKITLSGKSVLRRRLAQSAGQPLGAISFATHETFFSGAVQDGKELTIEVGDGLKDQSRIILTVKLVAIPRVSDK